MRELKSANPVKPAQESLLFHKFLSPFTALRIAVGPRNPTIRCLLFHSPTTPALLFPSLRPILLNHLDPTASLGSFSLQKESRRDEDSFP